MSDGSVTKIKFANWPWYIAALQVPIILFPLGASIPLNKGAGAASANFTGKEIIDLIPSMFCFLVLMGLSQRVWRRPSARIWSFPWLLRRGFPVLLLAICFFSGLGHAIMTNLPQPLQQQLSNWYDYFQQHPILT